MFILMKSCYQNSNFLSVVSWQIIEPMFLRAHHLLLSTFRQMYIEQENALYLLALHSVIVLEKQIDSSQNTKCFYCIKKFRIGTTE